MATENTSTPQAPADYSSVFAELAKAENEPTIKHEDGHDASADSDAAAGGGGQGGDGQGAGEAVRGAGAADTAGKGGEGGGAEAAGEGGKGEGEADQGLPTPEQVAAEQAAAKAAQDGKDGKDGKEQAAPPNQQSTQEKPIGDVLRELLAERGAQATKDAQEAEAKAQREAQERASQVKGPQYSDDEKKLVDGYQEQWPEIATAEQLLRREEYRVLSSFIFQRVGQVYESRIAQLEQQLTGVGQRDQASALMAAIPDYADVRQPVLDWIDKQPAGLKTAFEGVAKTGSVEDIKNMIDVWRLQSGKAAPAANNGGVAQSTTKKPPNQQAIDALAPPAARRAGPTQTNEIDPADYSGSFQAFAKAMADT